MHVRLPRVPFAALSPLALRNFLPLMCCFTSFRFRLMRSSVRAQ